MPTIIQVNNKSFKYHNLPLVAYFEEPLESIYYVKNPEQTNKHKLFRIEKEKVDFAIKMKTLPYCKHCRKTMKVAKVEPYIHGNYRITFQCDHDKCGKDKQTIYYDNDLANEA